MAVKIPNTALKQVRRLESLGNSNVKELQLHFKDPNYATLETFCKQLRRGDIVEEGWALDAWTLEGIPGGGGLLSFMCVPVEKIDSDGFPVAYKAVWSCKSVRNDVSIYAYCGTAASRTSLELWQKESNAQLAEAFTFHSLNDGYTTDVLNSVEQAIAQKIKNGIETVIRFYPVLSCTSTWGRIPSTFMDKIGFIDTPGAPAADETHAPSNLSEIINAHSWLKVQDDVVESGDNKWTRTESWMGIKTSDTSSGWDAELYGDNRWSMPYSGK
jgi:hypothetical protein